MKEDKKVKVIEYFGFDNEEEALEWYKKEKKRMEKLRNNIENIFIEFEAELDELFDDFFTTS